MKLRSAIAILLMIAGSMLVALPGLSPRSAKAQTAGGSSSPDSAQSAHTQNPSDSSDTAPVKIIKTHASGPGQATREAQQAQAVASETVMCLGDLFGTFIQVSGHNPGTTLNFQVSSGPTGIVAFSLSQSGPFTDSITVAVTVGSNGSGQSNVFFIKPLQLGQTTYSACANSTCISPVPIRVIGVASVVFEAIDSPLDSNPNAGGGMRIFPDRLSEADAVQRQAVRVRAVLSDPIQNVNVVFQYFDLDDPSSDDPDLDINGATGNDNRGSAGFISTTGQSVKTDASGVATLVFGVSMQPGDNFRIAATCEAELTRPVQYLTGIVVNGINLRDAEGNQLPTGRGKITDMLTVWRRVHIETDSMGPVFDNNVNGIIERIQHHTHANTSVLNLDKLTDDRNSFEGGRAVIGPLGSLGSFEIVSNSRDRVTVKGIVPLTALGESFILFDDDDFNKNDGTNPIGDTGEDIPAPDTSLLQESDDPAQNVLAPAYIRPIYDLPGNQDDVPFLLNIPDDDTFLLASYRFDNSGRKTSQFWIIYLLNSYQHDSNRDADPENEGAILGIVDDVTDSEPGVIGEGASIFVEPVSEATSQEPFGAGCRANAAAAHEIGHLFGAEHEDGALMGSSCSNPLFFSPRSLGKIRSILIP